MAVYVFVRQVPDPEAIVKVKSNTEPEIENKYLASLFVEIAEEGGLTNPTMKSIDSCSSSRLKCLLSSSPDLSSSSLPKTPPW